MSEKKYKILIVHNYYQIPGGEDTVVENEKRLLEEHGQEVILYTRHNSELKTLSKFQKMLIPFSTIFGVKTYREVRRIITEHNIDVIHVHNTLNLISPSVYYAGLSKKIPVVQTIHNFRLLCPGATFFRDGHICEMCMEKGLFCAVKHKCYRNSRLQTLACVISTSIHRMLKIYGKLNYICLTEFNKNKLLNLKQIRKEKVFVKPNFVHKTSPVIPYDQRKNQFIYVGRLDELKGIKFLLESWREFQMENCTLIVCGTGPLEEWCQEYVQTHQIKNIELKGFVPNEIARRMIGESKALILPTKWYEGFPMTIVESYSVGTMVIGTNLGNTGSLIEDEISGWKFSDNSKEELLISLRKAMENAEGVPQEIINKYSAENNYKKLREIYETCCNHYEYSSTL